MPTVTYVGREHLGLEQQLSKAVARGHTIIAVTGPSKCGKTVLRRKVIPDNVVAHVEGGQVATEDDFWEVIRAHLEAPATESVAATKQASGATTIGASIGPSFARLNASHNESDLSSLTKNRTFNGPQKGALLKQLIATQDVLVIDDFHYIHRDIRSTIVRSLKSAVFDGLAVVMLSVPYRAFDVLSAEAEMEGRFTHLSIPPWDQTDLIKIAEQGFPAMGLIVPTAVKARFAEESLASPLLIQSLCAQLCSHVDVLRTEEPARELGPGEVDLESLFKAVAKDFGLPAFRKLSAGPQSRTDRNPRRFANGQTGDIYEAVMAAVAYAGANEQTPYDDLRSALREVLAEVPPQKHEVTRAIQHMCEIAKKMQRSGLSQRGAAEPNVSDQIEVPTIDWADDTLLVNDVFLRFYLRWLHLDVIKPRKAP